MKLATRIFRKERGTGADQYYVTSPFGWRKDPITGEYKGHNGCDYGTHGNKWAQYALEDGIVESAYLDYYGAKCVRVQYPRLGYRCTHAHLDSICVSKGQSVNKDTILGYTGTTGYSTGIHLHLGVQRIGSDLWIDPESIEYSEDPNPPTPGEFPWDGIVKKGSPLYNSDGNRYPNGAACDRDVIVQGEVKIKDSDKYQIWGSTFRPNVVYADKENVVRKGTIFPFDAIVKKGSALYDANGNKYPNGAAANRPVTVRNEVNGKYEIYGETFRPHIVYCDKDSII